MEKADGSQGCNIRPNRDNPVGHPHGHGMPLQLVPSTQLGEPFPFLSQVPEREMNHENQEGKISPPCQGVIYAVTTPGGRTVHRLGLASGVGRGQPGHLELLSPGSSISGLSFLGFWHRL